MALFDGRRLKKRKLSLAQRLAEGQFLYAMRHVELLHQPGRAIVIYIPQARHHSRDAGDQKRLRQTAQRLVALLITDARATTGEDDQPRSRRFQVINLLALKRAVEDDAGVFLSLRGGLR